MQGEAWCCLQGRKEGALFAAEAQLSERLGSDGMALPTRRVDVDLQPISRVLHTPLVCYPNTAAEFQMQPLHRGSSVEERQVSCWPAEPLQVCMPPSNVMIVAVLQTFSAYQIAGGAALITTRQGLCFMPRVI